MIKTKNKLLAFVLLFAATAGAQPVATWVETEHDFGVIDEANGRVTCHLRLTNTGDEPLLITRVQPTCGCTAGDYPREAIAPGDTAAVTLTYNPANRPGEFNKEVYVYTNTTPSRSTVVIRGNAIPVKETLERNYPIAIGDLRIARDVVPLGEMSRTSFRLGYISGYNAGHDTIVVSTKYEVPSTKYQDNEQRTANNEQRTADNEQQSRFLIADCLPQRVAPASTVTVTVRLDGMEAPQWGLNEAQFNLQATEQSGNRINEKQITVTGIVVDDFKRESDEWRANPPHATIEDGVDRVVFPERPGQGRAPQGGNGEWTATVKLRNTGGAPLEVRRLWCPEAGVTATASRDVVKPGKSCDITVTVDPSQIEGDILNATLTIFTNDPDCQRLPLRVVGSPMKG